MASRSSYSEKLRDPRWQKKRLEIMARDGFACQSCKSTKNTLNVHHWRYRRDAQPWEYDDRELACLCEECHLEEERKKAILAEVLLRPEIRHLIQTIALGAWSERRTLDLMKGLYYYFSEVFTSDAPAMLLADPDGPIQEIQEAITLADKLQHAMKEKLAELRDNWEALRK